MATIFGSGIKRREDPRLITGTATYTDDLKLAGLTYAAILRSPYAHAEVTKIDERREKGAGRRSGVHRCRHQGARRAGALCLERAELRSQGSAAPLLAYDKVRYVGDGVAMVVAETRAARGTPST